jgi:hypothetical protein
MCKCTPGKQNAKAWTVPYCNASEWTLQRQTLAENLYSRGTWNRQEGISDPFARKGLFKRFALSIPLSNKYKNGGTLSNYV